MANAVHIPIIMMVAVERFRAIHIEPANPQMNPSLDANTLGALSVNFGVVPNNFIR
jgi:hypothetical protein